jgi:hypothetical protein
MIALVLLETACDVCGIQIGAGFWEQELFLYPVQDTTITKDEPIHYDSALLRACGSCAERRNLPQWLRVSPILL